MTENINRAQEELYDSLKNYREVVGASIRGRAENQYIVILLSQLSDKIHSRIPEQFKGNKVTYEVTGPVRAQKKRKVKKGFFRRILGL